MYICEFCRSVYAHSTAVRLRFCCCGEQLTPEEHYEGDLFGGEEDEP